ncbi:MAG: AAA family ATPase [Collimonas sp.]|uniref:MutS-related protein n=1 Tax=Collimonas sp. TaxID=1963772 RepID=UPI0032642907
MVNPLPRNAVPVSIALDGRGVFLSGQNGAGKSTVLRTIGLNLVIGRAFGFCYAASASMSSAPVYCSIQIEDSMNGGESLYMAELRRARELLQASERDAGCVFLIDEIFRGTNQLDSVSAAAAVLHSLAQRSLLLVSSHNLVLSPLLERWLTPLRVERKAGSHDDMFLAPGILVDPNGIALLTSSGFNAEVASKADKVSAWLSDYLSHPKECPNLLDNSQVM